MQNFARAFYRFAMNSLTLFVIHGMSAGKLLAALKGQNMSNASVIVWRMSNLAWQEGSMKKIIPCVQCDRTSKLNLSQLAGSGVLP